LLLYKKGWFISSLWYDVDNSNLLNKIACKLFCPSGGNMVSEIDKRDRLREEPFNYQITKKGTVIIYYKGKQIKIVKDGKAAQLIEKLIAAENIMEVQLLLAKITGNFKHGNEKTEKINK